MNPISKIYYGFHLSYIYFSCAKYNLKIMYGVVAIIEHVFLLLQVLHN